MFGGYSQLWYFGRGGRSFWRRDFLFWFSDLQLSASLMFWSENYILWSQDKLAWFAEPNDKAECSPFLVELLPLFLRLVLEWKTIVTKLIVKDIYHYRTMDVEVFFTQITEKDGYEHFPSSYSLKKVIVILYSPGLDENLLIALSLILDGK